MKMGENMTTEKILASRKTVISMSSSVLLANPLSTNDAKQEINDRYGAYLEKGAPVWMSPVHRVIIRAVGVLSSHLCPIISA